MNTFVSAFKDVNKTGQLEFLISSVQYIGATSVGLNFLAPHNVNLLTMINYETP